MKKLRAGAIVILFILIAIGTVFAGSYLFDNYLSKSNTEIKCETVGQEHAVVIEQDVMTPGTIEAKLCDTLRITNADDKQRLVAFGYHERHIYYNGVEQKTLGKNDSFKITLNEAGTFTLHDHLQEEVEGSFTVQK